MTKALRVTRIDPQRGLRFRLLMEEKKWKVGELADHAGVNRRTIGYMREGRDVTVGTMEAVADAMAIEAWELLREISEEKTI